MKISEVIKTLEWIRNQMGDVQVKVTDGDENYDLKPKAIRAESEEAPEDANPDDTFGNGWIMIAVIDITV